MHTPVIANDLRGPANLVADSGLTRVGWSFAFGSEPASFDLERRVIERTASGLRE